MNVAKEYDAAVREAKSAKRKVMSLCRHHGQPEGPVEMIQRHFADLEWEAAEARVSRLKDAAELNRILTSECMTASDLDLALTIFVMRRDHFHAHMFCEVAKRFAVERGGNSIGIVAEILSLAQRLYDAHGGGEMPWIAIAEIHHQIKRLSCEC